MEFGEPRPHPHQGGMEPNAGVGPHVSTTPNRSPTSGQAGSSRPPSPRPAADLTDYQTVFTNSKAGMEGVDKEHVKRVVWEASQGSAHFKNEQRKQAGTDERIKRLKEQAQALSAADLARHTHDMDRKLTTLEAGRDLTRTWIHVDMDAFYAACQEQVNPALKELPMAVGGIGMITTANYPARKFGVRAAMPGFIAKKLCPQLVFVPLNFARYTAASEVTRTVFARYDPLYEAGSLDEAHLDVTEYCAQRGMTGAEVAAALRREVEADTGGLTCSCGVAPNKLLAKVCSDINKPNGQYVLGSSRDQVAAFVATLPVRKVPGVGRVTEQVLASLGVTQCRDLYEKRGMLAALFLPASLDFFMAAALGLGETRHGPRAGPNDVGRKGMSCERTFKPISAWPDLEAQAQALVHSLVSDLASESLQGNCITLKLKLTDFKVTTHSRTLPSHAHSYQQLLPPLINLLKSRLPCELRLMGVRMSGLRKLPGAGRGGGGGAAPGTLEWFLKPNGAGGSGSGQAGSATAATAAGVSEAGMERTGAGAVEGVPGAGAAGSAAAGTDVAGGEGGMAKATAAAGSAGASGASVAAGMAGLSAALQVEAGQGTRFGTGARAIVSGCSGTTTPAAQSPTASPFPSPFQSSTHQPAPWQHDYAGKPHGSAALPCTSMQGHAAPPCTSMRGHAAAMPGQQPGLKPCSWQGSPCASHASADWDTLDTWQTETLDMGDAGMLLPPSPQHWPPCDLALVDTTGPVLLAARQPEPAPPSPQQQTWQAPALHPHQTWQASAPSSPQQQTRQIPAPVTDPVASSPRSSLHQFDFTGDECGHLLEDQVQPQQHQQWQQQPQQQWPQQQQQQQQQQYRQPPPALPPLLPQQQLLQGQVQQPQQPAAAQPVTMATDVPTQAAAPVRKRSRDELDGHGSHGTTKGHQGPQRHGRYGGQEAQAQLGLQGFQSPGHQGHQVHNGRGDDAPQAPLGIQGQQPRQGDKGRQAQPPAQPAGRWACGMCTYAGNHATVLRCEMCDLWRGSSGATSSEQPLLAAAGAAVCALQPQPRAAGKGTSEAKAKGQTGLLWSVKSHQGPVAKAVVKAIGPDAAGGVPEGQRRCVECGQDVAVAEWQEHVDVHTAMRLSLQHA